MEFRVDDEHLRLGYRIWVNIDSVVNKPFVAPTLERIVVASLTAREAAAALYAHAAEDEVFTILEPAGQKALLWRVIRGYFPNGDVPNGLVPILHDLVDARK